MHGPRGFRGRRRLAVEADRMGRAAQPLACGAARADRAARRRRELAYLSVDGLPGRDRTRRVRRRRTLAAAGGGHAADVRAEAGGRHAAANEAPEEDSVARCRDARIDRTAERADEADVDAARRELRVETCHDVALRARQVVLNLR